MQPRVRASPMRFKAIRGLLSQLNQQLDSARPAVQMWVFAAVGAVLTSLFFFLTRPTVNAHENQRLLGTLHELIPETVLTPAALKEMIDIPPWTPGLSGLQIYRLREGETLKAIFLKATTSEGYSGDIEFAMAIRPNGKIIGVRVLRHRETPGLGDWIENVRSNWILAFEGKSLEDPLEMHWGVRKDGGAFDQFTGATITPRAVVKGVHETLKRLKQQGETLEEP